MVPYHVFKDPHVGLPCHSIFFVDCISKSYQSLELPHMESNRFYKIVVACNNLSLGRMTAVQVVPSRSIEIAAPRMGVGPQNQLLASVLAIPPSSGLDHLPV